MTRSASTGKCAAPVAALQGRSAYDTEALEAILDRNAPGTRAAYNAQWKWWELFCRRRGVDPIIRVGTTRPEKEWAERLFLDFVLHSQTNLKSSVDTIKQRLFAIKCRHAALGESDPLAEVKKCWLALAGLKRRTGTGKRKKPATPAMLRRIKAKKAILRDNAADVLVLSTSCQYVWP